MKSKRYWSLLLSLILIFNMTISMLAIPKPISESKNINNSLPPIITVRVNGSPRLPSGTVVSVSIGGDCDKAKVVKITIGPAGGGTARVDMNGCRPTNKTYPVGNALVGKKKQYYYGKGTPIGTGGTSAKLTLYPK